MQNLRTGETSVVEVPVPLPRPGTALVRTCASLVSAGTERMVVEFAEKSLVGKARARPDLVRQVLEKARREGLLGTIEAAFSRLDQPMALGYSSAGIVSALGDDFEGIQIGQRVACAGGGYATHAEYAVVPANLLVPIPVQVDFESAAFTTLGAIALHGFRLAQTQLGERVAVIGLGLLGLLSLAVIRAAGCHGLGIDLDDERVKLAKTMGFEAVQREAAEEAGVAFSRGQGCDAIMICADTASADPVELAGVLARDRARVVAVGAVGLIIPRKIYYEKELRLVNSRSYGPGRYDPSYEEEGRDYPIGFVRWTEGRNLEAFVELLANGQVDVKPLITHRFPIENASQAYTLITGKTREPYLGILLTYGERAGEDALVDDEHRRIPSPGIRETLQPAGAEEIGLGVFGAGNFAKAVLLPVVRKTPGINLVGVASASGLNAQHAASKFGFSYATTQEEQILNDPRVNTVAVLTRHNLHARQVIAALRSGKHVFCEKPLALNLAELDEISAVLNESSVNTSSELPQAANRPPLLMVGFNRRFSPLGTALREFLEGRQEPLVAHYLVNAGYLPPEHWLHDPLQGGGRIIGEGCHFIDLLTFLVGEPPSSVVSRALPDAGRYRADNVVMTFTFPDKSIGTISYLANGDRAFPKERVEVFAGGRVAILDDYRSLEMIQEGKRRKLRSPLRQDKGHFGEWQAFGAAIRLGGPPPIPYRDVFGVTRASFAALQALHSQEQVEIRVG
ncbi:MAG TPA: bi-domain-containing oxidoreductase [Anaerolineales bacterium]|nr:bi-domain-containing oxidoreductase [Anaerolineales bacterium]